MASLSTGKLFCISIPTWNRSAYLKGLLVQLISQIDAGKLQDRVQILVSNNNSEDDTEAIVKVLQQSCPYLDYHKNEINIGAKSNVLKSMEIADSKYVMVLGDDDRVNENAIKNICDLLSVNSDIGLLIDQAEFKKKKFPSGAFPNLSDLLRYYYWYLGNAGCFVIKTDYVKEGLAHFGYDYLNECWPQTQLMIWNLVNHKEKILLTELSIHAEGAHLELMAYTSYYLWRTCYYELMLLINALRKEIPDVVYSAAREYMKKSLPQQLFNILQCGVFIDYPEIREKTRRHIYQHLNLFSFYERLILFVIAMTLALPTFISRPFSNISIFILKGNAGLKKKNEYVRAEISKKKKAEALKSIAIRSLEFEK